MSQQQLVLEPLGLVTEPNKLGQIPAGALSIMTDCVERSPGVIENIQAWQTKVTVAGTDVQTTAMFAVPMDNNRVVVIYNTSGSVWKYRWYDLVTGAAVYAAQNLSFNAASLTFDQSINIAEQPGFSFVRHGLQTFVNLYSTVFVWDDPTGATLASSLGRPAGLQRLRVTGANVTILVNGNPMPANSYANYVAINTRMVNGKKVVSPPSAAIPGYVTTPGAAMQVTFKLRAGEQAAGDIIELYRTKTKPSGLTGVFLSYQAGEEAGAEYQRVTSYTITSADIAAVVVTIFDTTPDASLGEALYTNQALFGAGAAAEAPPAVELLSSFKGYLFGFSTTRAPSFSLRPTGTWGGFESTDPIATITTGLGTVWSGTNLTGASFSSGSTTINVTPTSQLQYISVGMAAFSSPGGSFNAFITAIGPSSFTIDTPTTGSSGGTNWGATDYFGWGSPGSTDVAIARSWTTLVNQILFGNNNVVALRAQSLKLASTTPSNFVVGAGGFTAQPTDRFDVYARYLQDSRPQLGVQSSKGLYFDPQINNSMDRVNLTYVSEEKLPRAFVWSEQDQPEAWPFVNEDSFSRGTVNAVASTADALVLFYTDGIWRLSGTGGTAAKGYDWRADPIATGITVIGSQAAAVLLNKVYAMTSEGLIVVDGSSSANITQGRVHDQLSTPPWSNQAFTLSTASFVIEDEEHDEILMREPSATGGKMWIYNTHTDRLSQTTSHTEPMTAFYSRALRSPVVVGRDGGTPSGEWNLKAQTGAYGNFSMTYARIYADNPFAQRHWQTLNVSAETSAATIATTFNGVSGGSRALGADGRAGFEIPRNAPAIGNTMEVGIAVTTSVRTKLHGFSIDYRDHTERRRNR